MIKDIFIPQPVQDILLNEAKAVYGATLERLEIIPCTAGNNHFANKSKTATEPTDNYDHLQGLDSTSVWFKIRKYLVKNLGCSIIYMASRVRLGTLESNIWAVPDSKNSIEALL